MELLLFAIISVIIARWFEKRFRIAAAAHSVLFLVFGLCLLYCSGNHIIESVMRMVSGDTVYEYIRFALQSPMRIMFFGYSAYLVVNLSLIFMIIAVTVAVSHALVRRAESARKKTALVPAGKNHAFYPMNHYNKNKEKKYIKYCRILN